MSDVRTCTIFYLDQRRFDGEPGPLFGVRVDGQILPRGSVTCGFMLTPCQNCPGGEVLAPPYFRKQEEKLSWEACLREARCLLKGVPGTVKDWEERLRLIA